MAIADTRDRFHQPAGTWYTERSKEGNFFITSFSVFAETVTTIRTKLGCESSIRFGANMRRSPLVRITFENLEFHKKAWNLFARYDDWEKLSYVDCLSFVLMKEMLLSTVFAFDDDFPNFGFTQVPFAKLP